MLLSVMTCESPQEVTGSSGAGRGEGMRGNSGGMWAHPLSIYNLVKHFFFGGVGGEKSRESG